MFFLHIFKIKKQHSGLQTVITDRTLKKALTREDPVQFEGEAGQCTVGDRAGVLYSWGEGAVPPQTVRLNDGNTVVGTPLAVKQELFPSSTQGYW